MKISIIIPAFNEEGDLPATLDAGCRLPQRAFAQNDEDG